MAVYLNDRFLENNEALLHVSDLSMQRGYAIFDFFRTIHGRPLFMNDHLNRFYLSAAGLRLPVKKSKTELSDIILELILRAAIPEAGIRIMLTGGQSPDTYQPAEPNLLITCNPVKVNSDDDFKKGISIITYEHQRELPLIKSINYQMAVWLQPVLKEQDADDVLYCKNGLVTEFPRSNVFIVTSENILVTPSQNVLLGVTRKNVLEMAKEMMKVEERNVSVEELMNAQEVFLTSTTKKILPVVKINGKMVGNGLPGNFTGELYKKFRSLEEKQTELLFNH